MLGRAASTKLVPPLPTSPEIRKLGGKPAQLLEPEPS
jgi:hypothetical protein